jgi:hypothetical protein
METWVTGNCISSESILFNIQCTCAKKIHAILLFVLILLHSLVSLYYSLRVQFALAAHLYHAQLFPETGEISKQVFKKLLFSIWLTENNTNSYFPQLGSAPVKKCHNRSNHSERK